MHLNRDIPLSIRLLIRLFLAAMDPGQRDARICLLYLNARVQLFAEFACILNELAWGRSVKALQLFRRQLPWHVVCGGICYELSSLQQGVAAL